MKSLLPVLSIYAVATVLPANADPFAAPASYYDSATGAGSTLKDQLHDLIDDHTVYSYNDARAILQDTDVDPDDPDRLILVYDRVSLDVSGLISSPGIPGWDSGASWNREHTWPRSRGVNSSGADNSDLHQLRPSDPGINSSRSNLNFGGEYGQSFGRVTDGGVTVWYPGDEDAGMIARQQFYMAVRYDGSDPSTEDLELASGNPASSVGLGDLDRLIEWHYAAAPDDFERRRNNVIYDDYQGNRNPFVDRPEYVWSVFVDQANDSQISVASGVADGTGGSSLSLDLGAVFVGGAGPATESVTLNKTGGDGTYFALDTNGATTSSLEDGRHAFRTNTTDSVTFSVGLDADSNTAGFYGGSVLIDNLDVTAGGGVGRGAQDGDDVISLSYSVFDHAVASFSEDVSNKVLTLDFGEVSQSSGVEGTSFSVFNLEQTEGFTASLGLADWSFVSGDESAFDVTGPTDAIAAGSFSDQVAQVDTSVAGLFSATWEIIVGDTLDAAGAQSETLTLHLLAEVVADALLGDYNGNGMVDAADYTVWADSFGSTTALAADSNGDGVVNAADYTVWADNFGNSTASVGTSVVVPEPASLVLVLLGASGLWARRLNRTSSDADRQVSF